jgi:hypothetical protein
MTDHHALPCLIAIVLTAGASGVPSPANADVYRCTGPDGQIIFTDNRATCPGSEKHEPAGKLQTITADEVPAISTEEDLEPAAPAQERRESPARDLENERAQKKHWQQKKRMKEEELRALQKRHAQLSKYVTACNRGMEIISKDETGMKFRVSCEQIQKEYEETGALQEPIHEYLETGLERECRQAGCLPGWIR